MEEPMEPFPMADWFSTWAAYPVGEPILVVVGEAGGDNTGLLYTIGTT